jgi:hypothetical protein
VSETTEAHGPIDFLVIEWSGSAQPNGEALPELINLVELGIVRLLDLAFFTKDEAGNIAQLEIDALGQLSAVFADFEGASSGLLDDSDLAEAANALEPGVSAAVLVWENTWAAPFVGALRSSGAEVVASGRIPAQDVIDALEALEA